MPTVVPMFPLPGAFLFPGQLLPLHVFEPRYRQMVRDLLDAPGRLVLATIRARQPRRPGAAEAGAPAVLPVAGLGEIARYTELPDGRFLLLVLGLARVTIEEAPSAAAYRCARIGAWSEEHGPAARADALREQLVRAIEARTGCQAARLDGATTGQLADLLAQCLHLPPARMERIFAEPRVVQRAEHVLAAHDERPPD